MQIDHEVMSDQSRKVLASVLSNKKFKCGISTNVLMIKYFCSNVEKYIEMNLTRQTLVLFHIARMYTNVCLLLS